MKIKLLDRLLVILIFIFMTACQRSATVTNASLPVQPGLNPTTMSMPTNLTGYPAGNQSTLQNQASTNAPYLAPTSGPAPTIQQPTPPPSTATATASPENTQSIQYIPLQCSQSGDLFQCVDDQLDMKFAYPSRWGKIKAELVNSACGGAYYGYLFEPPITEVRAGGVSKDFCKQMGGDLFSLFKGYDPGHGCNEFPGAQDCQQVSDHVVVASLYPTYPAICDPGPGSMTTPTMTVGISIPENHPTAGLVFAIDFLSTKGKEQLFAPFGGVAMDLGKCLNTNTESTYTKLVNDISFKVTQGILDDETTRRVKEIQDFAGSITFVP
jgi:hypothetical protein